MSIGSTSANNVNIYENDITVKRNPLKFNLTNKDPEAQNYVLNVSNNILKTNDAGSTLLNGSYGLVLNNNTLDHGFEVFDSHNISFSNNIIDTNNDHGFDIRLLNTGILVSNNDISVSSNKQCINIDSTTSTSEVTETNNSCQ